MDLGGWDYSSFCLGGLARKMIIIIIMAWIHEALGVLRNADYIP